MNREYHKWIVALTSLAVLCTAVIVIAQTAAACPQGCQCNMGGPCTCPPGGCEPACTCPGGTCGGVGGGMYNPGYATGSGGQYGLMPTAFPGYPGGQPGFPTQVAPTGMPFPAPGNRTMPMPTMMPGAPFPGPGNQTPMPTMSPGMPVPTMMPGLPFPGRATPAPSPTAAPTTAPAPTVAPNATAMPTTTPMP